MKYPDLKNQPVISLDIETYDPLLLDKGPGVYRKDGHILGCAITTTDGFSEYYDIGHEETNPVRKQKNIAYLKEQLAGNNKKLGANLLYDIDWLQNGYGINVNGELHDVQYAESLLDEYSRSYSLDNLALKYLNKGKKKSRITEYAESKGWKGDARKHLSKMPLEMVREYALEDTVLPIEIFRKQWACMKEQNLLEVYHMEIALTPLLLQMRKQGVRVNQDVVADNRSLFNKEIRKKEVKLFDEYGEFNYNSSKQMAVIFDSLGLPYPTTDKKNPSISNVVLERTAHPIAKEILEVKRMKRVVSSVFENILLDPDTCIDGRIHGMFHPLKKDGKGTITGRFSGTNPNLQNQPSKADRFGKECRAAYIPEEGHLWGKLDYSQIEYRILAHYAQGDRADQLRHAYCTDPTTDYHKTVMQWTGLERKYAKAVNFGSMYGMGAKKCAESNGWDLEHGMEIVNLYHSEMPYVRHTMNVVGDDARQRGYIVTLLGRRGRVDDWIRNNGGYYKMLNKLIQGTAADVMKKGMLDAYKAGVFNVLKPHLTVHDELDVSIPQTKEGKEATKELAHCMESCVKLRVPIRADIEVGDNWGDVSETRAEEFLG